MHVPKLTPGRKTVIRDTLHWVVLVLSVALIVYISIETFRGTAFMADPTYMTFQFWVCVVFLIDFFVETAMAERHWRFFWHNIFMLLISIPYLNIINMLHVEVGPEAYYYLRYIPLVRGAYAMVVVIYAVSTARIVGIFWGYMSIIVLALYFASMLFYVREQPVNPDVNSYWTALWWGALELTTIGSPINPCTPTGKVLAAILAAMGMIIFPLFTVYLSDMVRRYVSRHQAQPQQNQQKSQGKQ